MCFGFCLSVVYVACACHFGYAVAAVLVGSTVDYVALLGIGCMLGVVSSAWLAYLLNLWTSLSLKFGLVNMVLLLGLSIPFRLMLKKRKRKKLEVPPWWSIVFSVVLPGMFLFWFIWFSLYRNEVETRGACYGDLPFHLNLISSFAYGCNSQRASVFDIVTPFYANVFLAYPFISNFYSAVLVRCFGASGHACLVIPSTVCGFALFAVFAGIVRTFCNCEEPGGLAPWLFLFTGGLGFIQWVIHKELRGGFYIDFVQNLGKGKTGSWFQTIIHVLLPQRASLHSLPIAWAIILLLMRVGHSVTPKPREFACIGLLVACLPQVQPHSVIACAEWGVCYALLHVFPLTKRKFKAMCINYGVLAFIAISLGGVQMLPYVDRTKPGFWRVNKLWKLERRKTLADLWWNALGVQFVLSMFHGPSIMNKTQWLYFLPSLAVWLISNYFIYQPWHMDNTKVFNAAWLPIALSSASNYFWVLLNKRLLGKILACVLLFFACFSGILAASMAVTQMYPLWQPHDKAHELAEFAKSNSDPKSVWVLDPWHAHPITTLAGRQSFSGYNGWSSSHGLSEGKRNTIIRSLTKHPEDTRESDSFGIDFVCTKKADGRITFNVSETSTAWKLVFENERYRVYQRTKASPAFQPVIAGEK